MKSRVPNKKVVVAMSGGVDSSVAALLLKQAGYSVTGVFMQNWDGGEFCTSKTDSIDAIAVADQISIDIDVVNFSREYKDEVFNQFLHEYTIGNTPNPDIYCNSKIKFKVLLDYALKQNAVLATGHYAKITFDEEFILQKAFDKTKDQSYFLYRLNQHQLKNTIFPLENISKTDVRKIAEKFHLSTANKKDSTGICFIGEQPFRKFLMNYLPSKIGNIVNVNGDVIGKHNGVAYYTIGQRNGLQIGGAGEAWYVAKKHVDTNELLAVQGKSHEFLWKNKVLLKDIHFISNDIGNYHITAKIRYRMIDASCRYNSISSEVDFDLPQWAPAPGQSLVMYNDDICVGGGIIERVSDE